jgi:DNA-binding MarR family transcriptional regulator
MFSPLVCFYGYLLVDSAHTSGLISLTKSGLKVIDRAVTVHMEVELAMIESFSAEERARFAGLLRTLLQYLEA